MTVLNASFKNTQKEKVLFNQKNKNNVKKTEQNIVKKSVRWRRKVKVCNISTASVNICHIRLLAKHM